MSIFYKDIYCCNSCSMKRFTGEIIEKCVICGADVTKYEQKTEEILQIFILIREYLTPDWIQEMKNGIFFPIEEGKAFPREIVPVLADNGYLPFVRKKDGIKICNLIRTLAKSKKQNIALHIMLFILTIITTTVTGYFMGYDSFHSGYINNLWFGAFGYSFGLMFILGSHEYAHWVTAKKHGIQASFPFFIPMIPVVSLGTIGAVINIRTPPPDKETMVKLGASGPIAGLIASVIIIFIGLKMSPVIPLSEFKGAYITLGEPYLFKLIAYGVQRVPEGKDILLHPLAMAGWFALIVNGFNLLPIGQLDGGHIARAYLSNRNHMILSFIIVFILFIMGIYLWRGWIILGIIGLILSIIGNPGAIEEENSTGIVGKILTLIALITLFISFTPQPMKVVVQLSDKEAQIGITRILSNSSEYWHSLEMEF